MSAIGAAVTHAGAPGERAITRALHRLFFIALGTLPGPISRRARAGVFNRLFASGSPWPYADCPYESVKREHLIARVPHDARTIVELGCADGHNLQILAEMRPGGRVIGADISERACALARERTRHQPEVEVVHGDSAALVAQHPDLAHGVDAIVISEVLYYLGSGRNFTEQLAPLGALITPGGCVIAVHTCADAASLHRRAAAALRFSVTSEQQVGLADRSFTISVLTRIR